MTPAAPPQPAAAIAPIPALQSAEAGVNPLIERTAAARSCARRDGDRLLLAVAPGDEAFAAALAAAFSANPGLPAGTAPASRALLTLAARVAASDVGVLIEGPTGTGKECLAQAVHRLSPRRDIPLVAVNCAALPEAMLEATLFGHERGAFTGAVGAGLGLFRAAAGGTLFLDEVAELPLALQAKLLRALQEREVLPVGATRPVRVDVRIVAAANRGLAAEVEAGRFRADLFYRLAVFPLRLTALCDRREDVLAITAALLLRGPGPILWPSPAALAALIAHDWPGNVRELGNVLDRARVLADGDRIEIEHLFFDRPVTAPASAPLAPLIRRHEDRVIRAALAETRGRRAAAERDALHRAAAALAAASVIDPAVLVPVFTDLTRRLCEAALMAELQLAPETLAPLVQAALAAAEGHRPAVLRVHPDMHEWLASIGDTDVACLADARLARDEIIVDAPAYRLGTSLTARLAAMVDML